jgi:folate-binding protein YgfZ
MPWVPVNISIVFSSSLAQHMFAVDFRKGCYVGQELTVRTYHTGVIRKRILPVELTSSECVQLSDA